jgi:hypothetical protein
MINLQDAMMYVCTLPNLGNHPFTIYHTTQLPLFQKKKKEKTEKKLTSHSSAPTVRIVPTVHSAVTALIVKIASIARIWKSVSIATIAPTWSIVLIARIAPT